MKILDVRNQLRSTFREGLIADYTEAHPLIEQGLRQSTTFLSLVSLVALVIGALGVATAIQAHLQQKMDSIAVMKCLGAKSAQVLRIYMLQTPGLGLVGSVAGIALGSLVQMAFPMFLERYFQIIGDSALRCVIGAAGADGRGADGASVHRSAAAGYPLYPAGADLPARDGRAPAIAARMVEAGRGTVISAVVILGFVGAIAAWLSDNAQTGRYFAFAIAVGHAGARRRGVAPAARAAHCSAAICRARAGPIVRQGIANLYRPGNHAGAAVMALGVGVMFTVTVWIVQRGLLQDIVRTAPPGMPNVYLLDITASNRDAVYDLLMKQPGLLGSRKCWARFRRRCNPSTA